MRKKPILFLISIAILFLVIPQSIAADTSKTSGLYTHVSYTSEFFPDYEEMSVTLYTKRTTTLNLNRSYDLLLKSYRIVFNNTLLAYIDYGNETTAYKPELEIIELTFDKEELEINTTDYNIFHKMIIQTSAVAISPDGALERIADDYLTVDIYIAREATRHEVLIALSVAFAPMILLAGIFFLRKWVDTRSVENVTFQNLLKYLFRGLFIRTEETHEEILPVKEKAEEPPSDLKLIITTIILQILSILNAFFARLLFTNYYTSSILLYCASFGLFVFAAVGTLKIFRRIKPKVQSEEKIAKAEPSTKDVPIQEKPSEPSTKDIPIHEKPRAKGFLHRFLRFD